MIFSSSQDLLLKNHNDLPSMLCLDGFVSQSPVVALVDLLLPVIQATVIEVTFYFHFGS